MKTHSDETAIVVIPARLGSTRLARKALAMIGGQPMVVRVWARASAARLVEQVIVATDSREIADAVRRAGGTAAMTSPEHPSGTDRVAEIARQTRATIYVNVQGDLPFLDPADLDRLVVAMRSEAELQMATLSVRLGSDEEWRNPNVVKVVSSDDGYALYFSRAPIPFARDGGFPAIARRHLGVYAYRRDFLLRLAALPPGKLESVEKLEQLRVLERGWRIKVIPAAGPPIEVDTEGDLEQARRMLQGA